MKCKHIQKNLVFYTEGEVSPIMEQQISQHLEQCTECRQKYQRLQKVWAHLTPQQVTAPPFFTTQVLGRLEDQYSGQYQPYYQKLWRQVLQPAAVYVVLIATGITLGILLGQSAGSAILADNNTVQEDPAKRYVQSQYWDASQMDPLESNYFLNE